MVVIFTNNSEEREAALNALLAVGRIRCLPRSQPHIITRLNEVDQCFVQDMFAETYQTRWLNMTKHSSWIAFISIWGVSFHMVAAMGGVASGLAYVHTSTSDLSIVLNKAAKFPFHHRLEYGFFYDLWVFLQQPHCKQSFVCLSFRFLKANVLHNSGLLGPALVASLARRPAPNLCTIYVLIREESDQKQHWWLAANPKESAAILSYRKPGPQPTSVTSVTQSAFKCKKVLLHSWIQ